MTKSHFEWLMETALRRRIAAILFEWPDISIAQLARDVGCVDVYAKHVCVTAGMHTQPKKSSWTPERLKLLKELNNAGLSGAQIAMRMGGVTRNAIIGKLHRLGNPLKAARSNERRKKPRRVSRSIPEGMEAVARPTVAVVSLSPLPPLERAYDKDSRLAEVKPGGCRYPYGDVGERDFHFCNRPRGEGRASYCEEHHKLCNTTPVGYVRRKFIQPPRSGLIT